MGKIYNALEKADKGQSQTQEDEASMPREEPRTETADEGPPPEQVSRHLVTINDPHSAVSEQFRLLKNNILFPGKGEPPRTIMVTSPSPGEGKSFVAANLAASISQSIDQYVLLMDCDLRSPKVHSMFGFEDRPIKGLSDYLANGTSLPASLQKTCIDKLTILPAGKIPSNPSELLSSEQMKHMLQEVKLRYNDRYIIMDTPPPYITSETSAIGRHVDGIVIVVRQGKTRIKEVQDIIDIYGREKILGVVKNFSEKSVGYGYGYHKYGYGYAKKN